MRDQLVELSRKIARVLREVLTSEAAIADDSLTMLKKQLTPVRIWGLAVILASWELSKPEKSRAELGVALGRSGIQAYWPQLDLMSKELTPFVDACRTANSPIEIADAITSFLSAVQNLGPALIGQVLQSSDFNRSARAIAKSLPEQDNKPAQPAQKMPEGEPEQIYVSPQMESALQAESEREQIAISMLLLAGWTRAEAEGLLIGKR